MRCFRRVGRGRERSQGQRPGTVMFVMQVRMRNGQRMERHSGLGGRH